MYKLHETKYTYLCILPVYKVHKIVYNILTRSNKPHDLNINQQPKSTSKQPKRKAGNSMKVTLLKEDKRFITLADAPVVREIITDMKEDESTPADYAKYAIDAAYNLKAYGVEVLKASAKIAKNARAWNAYNDHSETLDIWIDATAYVNGNEFIIIGAYLSDIWQITSDNALEIASQTYIRKFKEIK